MVKVQTIPLKGIASLVSRAPQNCKFGVGAANFKFITGMPVLYSLGCVVQYSKKPSFLY